jgi:hypothetical protein
MTAPQALISRRVREMRGQRVAIGPSACLLVAKTWAM